MEPYQRTGSDPLLRVLTDLAEVLLDDFAIASGHVARQFGHGLGAFLLGQLAPVFGHILDLLRIDVARTTTVTAVAIVLRPCGLGVVVRGVAGLLAAAGAVAAVAAAALLL